MPYWDMREHAMQLVAKKDGLLMEFGVWRGTTINFFATLLQPRTVYGFDSFEGLPEAWDTGSNGVNPKGTFTRNGRLPKVSSNVSLVKGLFKDTLPVFVKGKRGKRVAFVHIDCDLYQSAKDVFDSLSELDMNGAIILFDELYNYPNWEKHEYKAFNEFLKEQHYNVEYLAYDPLSVRVLARIRKVK